MFSIFHTSHCGSTLLGAQLSKSVPTMNEPDWSHELDIKDKQHIMDNHKWTTLIKYPSSYCKYINEIPGKKVFLYRPLYSHILKVSNNDDLQFQWEKMKPLFTEKIKKIELNDQVSNKFKATITWLDRVFNAITAKDTIYVNCFDYFKHPEYVAKQICKHFDIEYIPNPISYEAKFAGLNHTNDYINTDNLTGVEMEWVEPIDVIDWDLYRWVENEIEDQYPKVKVFR